MVHPAKESRVDDEGPVSRMVDKAGATTARWSRLDHDERRRQILAAARTLFSQRHHSKVSSAEIAQAAGVSRGLLNHYFGTKRELYLAVMSEMLAVPPVPVPADAKAEEMSLRQRVCESIDGWLELLSRNPETWLTALGVGEDSDPELTEILDRAREIAVDRVIKVTRLQVDAASREEVTAVLRGYSAMAEALTREWLQRGRLSRAKVHLTLEETLLRLICDVLPVVLTGDEGGDRDNGGDGDGDGEDDGEAHANAHADAPDPRLRSRSS